MPYKRKKWSPFTSNEYTEEELDQIAEAMAEKDSGERRRAEKSYQNMHDFGKGDIADSSQGSVWQKTDDKKKTNKYDRPKRRKKHYSVRRKTSSDQFN